MEDITNLRQEHRNGDEDTLRHKKRKAIICSKENALLMEYDKKINAISGNKENVLLLDSKRSLAQRARRERERLERTRILQPAIDSTHPVNNKLKRKIVEKQCLTYTSSVNCDGGDEMRRSNIISNVSGISNRALAQRARRDREYYAKIQEKYGLPMAERLHQRNVGVVIRENADSPANCIRQAERPHQRNVGIVIRENTDSPVNCIRQAQEKTYSNKTKGKGKATTVSELEAYKENSCAVAQRLHQRNVGIVIRENTDSPVNCIRQEQEKNNSDKTKGKGKAITVSELEADKENSCAVVGASHKRTNNIINVTIFGKVDRYLKHAVELLRQHNVHVHIHGEREYNVIRIREEKNRRCTGSKAKDIDWMQIYDEQKRINSSTLCKWRRPNQRRKDDLDMREEDDTQDD